MLDLIWHYFNIYYGIGFIVFLLTLLIPVVRSVLKLGFNVIGYYYLIVLPFTILWYALIWPYWLYKVYGLVVQNSFIKRTTGQSLEDLWNMF